MENELHLTDLIDVEMLQKIQDAFSDMTGIASVTTEAASGANYAIKTGRSWHLKKGLLQPISVTQDSWILPHRLLRTAEWLAVLSAARC